MLTEDMAVEAGTQVGEGMVVMAEAAGITPEGGAIAAMAAMAVMAVDVGVVDVGAAKVGVVAGIGAVGPGIGAIGAGGSGWDWASVPLPGRWRQIPCTTTPILGE